MFLYLFNSQLSIFNILYRSADTILHSNPIRRSAAMTHEVTDRHPAQALRRCATTPEDSLSAPGERGDVRNADAILHSNLHS